MGSGGGCGGHGECSTAVGVACLPLIPRVHLFFGWPDQLHRRHHCQDCYQMAPLGWTGVLKIFFPALTRVRGNQPSCLRCHGSPRTHQHRRPGTRECFDGSAADREESGSNYQLDQIPGSPTTQITDRFLCGQCIGQMWCTFSWITGSTWCSLHCFGTVGDNSQLLADDVLLRRGKGDRKFMPPSCYAP